MAVSHLAPVTASAPRLRRPGWRDPRLIVGLVLLFGSVAAGGRADIWAASPQREQSASGYQAPRQIASGVEVFAVSEPGSGLNSGRSGSLEVLVPEQTLAQVLDALANEAKLSVLPVLGTARS